MPSARPPVLAAQRIAFHRSLLAGVLTVDSNGIPNIADKESDASKALAKGIVQRLGQALVQEKDAGQTSGKRFEEEVADYLRGTFLKLGHLRPGSWEIRDRRSSAAIEIANFEQYEHLAKLTAMIEAEPEISSALGADYLITPDVVILRRPEPDEIINKPEQIADAQIARLTPLRSFNRPSKQMLVGKKEIEQHTMLLHASVSCKWTIRSDRAQNARSEALNLIRNRKGRVPHIVVITAEPLPSRLASLGYGTSDLDCVYHIALRELVETVTEVHKPRSEQQNILNTLVNGKRLRDIADLPLDLAI